MFNLLYHFNCPYLWMRLCQKVLLIEMYMMQTLLIKIKSLAPLYDESPIVVQELTLAGIQCIVLKKSKSS